MAVLPAHAVIQVDGRPVTPLTEPPPFFNPTLHLAPRSTVKSLTLDKLGLANPYGITDFAVTEPFQLLNETGVRLLLAEVLSKEIQRQCAFKEARLPWYTHAPFLRELWTSKEVIDLVSKAAGIALKPVMDYELGHTNILWPGPEEQPQDHWHCDSYPFVAVMLLSDPHAGGHTVLKKGDGTEVAMKYPAPGSCIVMQGQPIEHCARRAVSTLTEPRITTVCSFIPADPLLPDNSMLNAGRRNSQLPELFHDWAEYRLERVGEKALRLAQDMKDAKSKGCCLSDVQTVKMDIAELIKYLQVTSDEMRDPDMTRKDVL